MGVPPVAAVRFGQPTSQQYNNQSSSRSAAANNHGGAGGGCSASSRRSSGNGKLGLCDKIENYVAELGHWAVWRAIIIGQFLSLVLCFMTLLNHQINTAYQINLPTAQNLPHYVMMLLVYTTWMSCRGAGNGLFSVLRARGWRYLLLALIDVEANTLIAASHQFTSLASVQLLDCVAIPVALALSCLVLGVRYRMVHIVGVSICLMGVGCLVWAGIEESKDSGAAPAGKNQLVGDMLCLGGAVLFSIITVLQELTVKSVDIIEYLGMMGFFGTIICGSQVAVLERVQLEAFQYENVLLISFLVIYCITQFVFYSLIPVVLYETGATSLQLTLLTADFFNILLGMLIHQYKFHVLYFLSYVLVMTGIYTYAIKRTPMSTSTRRPPHSEPTAPDYRHMAYPGIGEVELCSSGTLDNVHGGGGLGRTSTLGSERESLPLSVSSDTAFTSFYGSQGNLKPSRSTARIPSATNLHDGSMRSS